MNRKLFISVLFTFLAGISLSKHGYASLREWQWYNPSPQGNHLNAVYGKADNSIYAVGEFGTIINFNGARWTLMESNTWNELNDICAFGNQMYAVGASGTLLFFDGHEWSSITSPISHTIQSICNVADTHLFAVGDSGTILHFDSSTWQTMSCPIDHNIHDVWGSDIEHVFAVSQAGTIIQYNGTQWITVFNDATCYFYAIQGISSTQLFAIGNQYDSNKGKTLPYIIEFNGSMWNIVTLPIVDNVSTLKAISLERNGTIRLIADSQIIYTFKDQEWRYESIASSQDLSDIWSMNTNSVLTVGKNGEILQFNGNTWNPITYGTQNTIHSMWGRSPNDIIAVGQNGLILSYDGSQWTEMITPTDEDMNSVWGNNHYYYAVGNNGLMLRYDGHQWTLLNSLVSDDLFGVWANTQTVVAVGNRGTILQWSADTDQWVKQSVGSTRSLKSVWGRSADDIYAVGKRGYAYHFNGQAWNEMSTSTRTDLFSITGSEESVYVSGKNGLILRYQNESWETMNSNTNESLNSIWANSDNNIITVGDQATIHHFDGQEWNQSQWQGDYDLICVWGSSDQNILAAGDNGVIIHYPNVVIPSIALSLPKILTEGTVQSQGYVSIDSPLDTSLMITLNTESSKELTLPKTVEISAGLTLVQFDIIVIDDIIHDGIQMVTIHAAANGFQSGMSTVAVHDNEANIGVWVVRHSPTDNQILPIQEVNIYFNQSIQSDHFDAQDIQFTGPSGIIPILNDPVLSNDKYGYRIFLPIQDQPGDYFIRIGPDIQDSQGILMDQDGDGIPGEPLDDRYQFKITLLDTTGPAIQTVFPNSRHQGPISSIEITFNEPIDPSSLDSKDIQILNPDNHNIAFYAINTLTSQSFLIPFDPQTQEGTYSIIIGPEISDISGNMMDQDKDNKKLEAFDDQFRSFFVIDQTGPMILSHSLFGIHQKAIDSFQLLFNESIQPESFTNDAVTVIGPDNTYNALQIIPLASDLIQVNIPKQMTNGFFDITIAPIIKDIAGNMLNLSDETYRFSFSQVLPDLLVTSVQHSVEAQAGQDIEVNWTVKNIGYGMVSETWVDEIILFSEEKSIQEQMLTVTNTIQLKPGESYHRSARISVPDVYHRHRWIGVQANYDYSLYEEDTPGSNFGMALYPLWITERPYPDLIVSDIQVPDMLPVGEKSTISWKIVNRGTGPTSASYWNDVIYLSLDAILDQGDIKIAVIKNKDYLSPGESYIQIQTIDVPSSITLNQYNILIQTDAYDWVEEFDQENNNIMSSTIQVISPSPGKLRVADIDVPQTAITGEQVTMSWKVQNIGGKTISNCMFDIILTKTEEIKPDSYRVLSQIFGGVYRPNETNTLHHTITIPSDIIGEYYIMVLPTPSLRVKSENETPPLIRITAPVLPDLLITDMDFSQAVSSGTNMQVNYTIINNGAGKTLTNQWQDVLFLSNDNILDDQDIFVGSIMQSIYLQANESRMMTIPIQIPSNINGLYTIIIAADHENKVIEQEESNNLCLSHKNLNVSQVYVDLIIDSLSSQTIGITGQPFTIQWGVTNQGQDTLTTSNRIDRFFLCKSPEVQNQDAILIGEYTATANPGANTQLLYSHSFFLPIDIQGDFYLFATTDYTDCVYEHLAEDNNNYLMPNQITILNQSPDLIASSIITPNNALAGTVVDLTLTGLNDGETTGYDFTSWIFLSSDQVFNADLDKRIGEFIYNQPIPAGFEFVITGQVHVPEKIQGAFFLFVQVDATNQVYEKAGEINNLFISPNTIEINDLPADLIIKDIQAPNEASAGSAIEIKWTVINQGHLPTNQAIWYDAFYLSHDSILKPGSDILLGEVYHYGTLAPNESYSQSTYVTLRQDLGSVYTIYGVTDCRHQIYENSNQDNNQSNSLSILVKGRYVDLILNDIYLTDTVYAGDTYTIKWDVKNDGIDPTHPLEWEDAIWISLDNQLDTNDISLGSFRHLGILSPGQTYQCSEQITLPKELSGEYYVIVQTDARSENDVYEYQKETNNTMIIQRTVYPARIADLKVTSINNPKQAWSSQYVTLSWIVENIGNADTESVAGHWYDSIYLSRDPYLDSNTDIYLDSVLFKGVLTTNNPSYEQSTSVLLPQGISGPFYFIVKTDTSSPPHVSEQNRNNNIMPSSQVLTIQLTTPADLIVTQVVPQSTGIIGESAKWIFEVKNDSTAYAASGWVDTLYLSKDQTWDESDSRITRTFHQGDLSDSETYSETVMALIPPVLPGDYYVICKTDILNQLRETSEDNNSGCSQLTITIVEHDIQANIPQVGAIESDQSIYYAYSAQEGEELIFQLVQDFPCLDMVVAWNQLPTRSYYDYSYQTGEINQSIVRIPSAQDGLYHILIQNHSCENSPLVYTLNAMIINNLYIHSVTPQKVSNAGKVTLTIIGAYFQDSIRAVIEHQNKQLIEAIGISYQSNGEISALFDLSNFPTGACRLRLINPDQSFVEVPIHIIANQAGHLVTNLILPPIIGSNEMESFVLEYANDGYSDIEIPHLWITSDKGLFREEPEGEFSSHVIDCHKQYDQATLNIPPGTQHRISIEFKTQPAESVSFKLFKGDLINQNMLSLNIIPVVNNNLSGNQMLSVGQGKFHYIVNQSSITYDICFENRSTANQPIRQLIITSYLSEQLDWQSFELQEIVLGNHTIKIPSGRQFYYTQIDLTDQLQHVIVDISAEFNLSNGLAKWTLIAIDPVTGEMSREPSAGFLPPNTLDRIGEGFVRYAVSPIPSLKSGTFIPSMATLIFDSQPPIDTPIMFNTIDAGQPESRINFISESKQGEIEVMWGGNDDPDGSGISTYSIYVSENKGPYQLWLYQTPATSGVFTGKPGATYSFYSIATDQVGNEELLKTTADLSCSIPNLKPYANAGKDQFVNGSGMFILDGSASYDPDYEIVSYEWIQVSGKSISFTQGKASQLTLTVPDMSYIGEHLTFKLIVTDTGGLTHSDSCTIYVVDNHPPYQPSLYEPINGSENNELTTVLTIQSFIDPDYNDYHKQTHWQVSLDDTFTSLVFETISQYHLTELPLPEFVLNPSQTYFWRVRLSDRYDSWSIWSDMFSFSTTSEGPITEEIRCTIDPNCYRCVNTIVGQKEIGVKSESETITITSLISLDPNYIPGSETMPHHMPLGLISFKIEGPVGSTVNVTIQLPEEAPMNATWIKYDPSIGWLDYASHSQFSKDRRMIHLEVQDGGFGDIDGVQNGIIIDPCGLAVVNEPEVRLNNESNDFRCFIESTSKPNHSIRMVIVLLCLVILCFRMVHQRSFIYSFIRKFKYFKQFQMH